MGLLPVLCFSGRRQCFQVTRGSVLIEECRRGGEEDGHCRRERSGDKWVAFQAEGHSSAGASPACAWAQQLGWRHTGL